MDKTLHALLAYYILSDIVQFVWMPIFFYYSSMCASIVRIELSLVNEASNKNTWNSHVTSVTSEFLPPTPS